MKKIFSLVLIALTFAFIGCKPSVTSKESQNEETGFEVRFPGKITARQAYTQDDAESYTIFLMKDSEVIQEKSGAPGSSARLSVSSGGTYTLVVKAYDEKNVVIAEGSAERSIELGDGYVKVEIILIPKPIDTGFDVEITWGEEDDSSEETGSEETGEGNLSSETIDSKFWHYIRIYKDVEEEERGRVTLVNTADHSVTGEFFLWTNDYGVVRTDIPTVPEVDSDGNYYFTFTREMFEKEDLNGNADSERFVLYTQVTGSDTRHEDLSKWDVRGCVMVYANYKVVIEAGSYSEVIGPVGTVTITNDEPTSSSVCINGDYTITEIWPLDPKTEDDGKAGGSYVVSDTMVFKKLSVKYGESITVPVKAGGQIIGLYQPKRDEKTSGSELVYGGPSAADIKTEKRYDLDGDGVIEATRAEVYGFAEKIKNLDPTNDIDAKTIHDYYANAILQTIYANEIKVTVHGSVNAGKSSMFGQYFFNHRTMVRLR